MTKHDAMKEYFEPKIIELVDDVLHFNFSDEAPDNISFLTNYSDKVIKNYVRASQKEYGFTILITKAYSTSADDLNLEAMNFAQRFMDWIEEQNRLKNYPDFGSDCEILKIENLQNMPNLAGVNQEEGLARYMLQCRVIYMEKKGVRQGETQRINER